ncbi:Putative Rho GTPaseactivating protein CG5521like [Caligus rogercresseyi]|uniref:Rho GTPaseactivating protein CG5521like n=1 Tax=Caligus rogercresseyi TaxID=217165 RepID=A0A7T8H0M9_CALRO|nr:Putative Rho GTPaseactivating protein CG5521like [Caligus rogercresseyi]
MSGGSVKGWLPDVAVVLWRRMLGSLGNINAIGDTLIHANIYKYLIELFEVILKIRSNQGVSTDNLSSPPPPLFVPPLTIFTPWCLRRSACLTPTSGVASTLSVFFA